MIPNVDGPENAAVNYLLSIYTPPFDLTSDMMLVAALAPTEPLRRAFPHIPFLSIFGRTPLVIWFSRTKEICYTTNKGGRSCIGNPNTALYNELTVPALLKRMSVFSPAIYATSTETILIGRAYGMPKRPADMTLQLKGRHFSSALVGTKSPIFIRATLLGQGKILGRILSLVLPLRLWPARFPPGKSVRVLLTATPRILPARIEAGELNLHELWLPTAARPTPYGLYFANQRMRMPPPCRIGQETLSNSQQSGVHR